MKYCLTILIFLWCKMSLLASIPLSLPERQDDALHIVALDGNACAYYAGKGLGLMDASGKRWTSDEYFGIYSLGEKYYSVQKTENGPYALINVQGKQITPFEFDTIYPFLSSFSIVGKMDNEGHKYAVIKSDGQIYSPWLDSILPSGDHHHWIIQNDGVWGILRDDKTSYFSPKIETVRTFQNGMAPALIQGKWGYVDASGNWIILPKWMDALAFVGKYATVKTSSFQWQMIDSKGNIMLPITYDSIKTYQDGAYSIAHRQGKAFLLGFNTLPINHIGYDTIIPFTEDGIALCRHEGKYAYVDQLGNHIFEADSLLPFQHGRGVFRQNEKWGWVNDEGEILQTAHYDEILSHQPNSILVRKGKQILYQSTKDKSWKEVFTPQPEHIVHTSDAILYPTQKEYHQIDLIKKNTITLPYDEVGDIYHGMIVVRKGEQYGYVDINGKELLSPIYNNVSIPNHLYYFTKKEINDSLIAFNHERKKSFALSPEWNFVGPYTEGKARILHKNGLMGMIDDKGNLVVPCKYLLLGEYHQGRAIFATLNGLSGYLDENGQEIIPAIYKFASDFDETGFAAVIKDEKYGFIHKSGNVVIPFMYDRVLSLSKGIASVVLDGKVGYINMQNKKLVPFTFDEAYATQNDLALVRMGIYWGYINGKGKSIIPWQYEEGQHFSEGKAWVKLNGKWGAVFSNGQYAVPFQYEQALPFENGYARVKLDGKWGLIDHSGKIVIPIICENISQVFEHKVVVESNKPGYGILIFPK